MAIGKREIRIVGVLLAVLFVLNLAVNGSKLPFTFGRHGEHEPRLYTNERVVIDMGHRLQFEEYVKKTDHEFAGPKYQHPNAKEDAVLYTLCRNNDLESLVETVLSWEDRFNHRYHYDWIFLNDEPFTDEFEEIVSRLVSGRAFFAVVPLIHWSVPDHIDKDRMAECLRNFNEQGILYGDNLSYRHMCRYNSGFFYEHELMKKYRYYWRVDGDTHMFCDIPFDVFTLMRENDYKYAFTFTMYEDMRTIASLWESTLKFAQAYPEYIDPNNLASFISEDGGRTYNGCHFWTNFEIADSEIWRSEAYTHYFEYLDQLGGFFYERWGDAPVHSVAASLFLPKEQIAHFDFVGYFHHPLTHIPPSFLSRPDLRCGINPDSEFHWNGPNNCIQKFYIAKDHADGLMAGTIAADRAEWTSNLEVPPREVEEPPREE